MPIILLLLSILGLHTPARDNGPCPVAEPAVLTQPTWTTWPMADDYSGDLWRHADGTVFGWAAEEDECILPIG